MKLEKGYYTSPRWSYEYTDCSMPMSFDTYSNCAHQCVYCFSFFQRAIGTTAKAYLHHKVKSVNVERVKRMFLDPDQYAGQFAPYIKLRKTMQWGGLSDAFDWYEQKFGKSLELLRFFREIEYPISISTKAVWWLYDDRYREALRGAENIHVKMSIITLDEDAAKVLEAGVPSPAERVEGLRELKRLGVGVTTWRFRPVIIGLSDRDIESVFDLAADAGCYSVSTEFLCIEKRATANHLERYRRISDVVGFDIWQYYRKFSKSGSGLLRLNYEIKRPYIERMMQASQRTGVKLFVSDAHHKEKSYDTNCCGLGSEHGALSNYARGHFAQALQIAKAQGSVKWSDIQDEATTLFGHIPFARATGYNSGGTNNRARLRDSTLLDYMRGLWNNPKSWAGPARYFGGVLIPAGKDENNDIIYIYNRDFVERGIKPKSLPDLLGVLNEKRRQLYPIYIPSRGRSHTGKTMRMLDEARIPYTLVVEPQEFEAYSEAFPGASILVLPESNQGHAYVCQFILDYARNQGLTWYWHLDDNIREITRRNTRCNPIDALLYCQDIALAYEDVFAVALAQKRFAFAERLPAFVFNKRVSSGFLAHTDALDFDLRYNSKVDTHWTISNILAGRYSIMVYEYAINKPAMGGDRGGLHEYYASGKFEEEVFRLLEDYPEYCTARTTRLGLDVAVNWSLFPGTPPLRDKDKAEHYVAVQQGAETK